MKSIRILLMLILSIQTSQNHTIAALSVAYFSPKDHPTKELIKLIDGAKKTIFAAVYMITDKNIAQALVQAKKERKVNVQIITDKITADSIYGKGKFLREQGIPVYVFQPPASNKIDPLIRAEEKALFYNADAIMHNKFALIDKIVLTGSFNWTQAAGRKNQENFLITDDKIIYESFKKEFENLKEKCKLLSLE